MELGTGGCSLLDGLHCSGVSESPKAATVLCLPFIYLFIAIMCLFIAFIYLFIAPAGLISLTQFNLRINHEFSDGITAYFWRGARRFLIHIQSQF